MILSRGPVALFLSAAVIFTAGACSPLGDDDGVEGASMNPPTATLDRQIVMSTFTPTEVISDDLKTATSEAKDAADFATATYRAGLPTPTTDTSVNPEDLLWPPRTRLETPSELVEAYVSTYSWQFSDVDQTYAAIEAPITPLNQGDPVQIRNGDQLALRYYGDEFRAPPEQLEVSVYDFESNSAVPIGPQGQQGEGLAFAIKTDPLQTLRVDPADPTFVLDGFPPGHYIIWAQGRWGMHPVLNRQIFVTWVYDIEIVE